MKSCSSIQAQKTEPAISPASSGARVVVEPWRGYVAQKQYAIDLCTKDWVLLVDADEEISPGLAEEIRAAINDPNAQANGIDNPLRLRRGSELTIPKLDA